MKDTADEETEKKLEAAVKEMKLQNAKLIGVAPCHWAVIRNIEIPSRDPNEIREIVNLQASRHTPFSRSEIVTDYLNLGVVRGIYTRILLIIVPRTSIMRFYDLAQKLRLKMQTVTFAPEAVAKDVSRRLHLDSEKSPVALVRVDATISDFLVISRGLSLFVRSFPVGSQNFVLEAETAHSSFIDEIRKSLEAYQGENIDVNPTTLILSGATKGFEPLIPLIQEQLKLSVKRLEDTEGIPMRQEVRAQYLEHNWSYLDVVTPSLFLEGLKAELIPEEIKIRRALEERSKEILKAGIHGVIVFALICGLFLNYLFFQKARADELARRFEPIRKEAQSLEENYSQIETVKTHLAGRGRSLEILAEMSRLLPQDLQLTDIRYESDGKFLLKGSSLSKPSVFRLVDEMEKSDLFRNVQAKSVVGRVDDKTEVADFEIVSAFE
jgi:Tfp pilus assembly PilM family ATPase/Tfp pilus assembly protein PilN